jgi:hypothetical protein
MERNSPLELHASSTAFDNSSIDCVLPYDIPTRCNVKFPPNEKELIHEFRIHAQADGNFRDARGLLIKEMRNDRKHGWKKAFSKDKEFYRKNFHGWE